MRLQSWTARRTHRLQSQQPGPEGQTFSKWVINDGAYDIGDAAYEQTIWLTVKDQDLNIRAEYEGIQYTVTVKDGTANYEKCVSGAGVTLTANKAPAGYEFDYCLLTHRMHRWQMHTVHPRHSQCRHRT